MIFFVLQEWSTYQWLITEMAGSKKAKGKDFQKVKLKVGKIKRKGLNFTDTSFKSKKIVIREQLKGEIKGVKDQFVLATRKLSSNNPSNVTDGSIPNEC